MLARVLLKGFMLLSGQPSFLTRCLLRAAWLFIAGMAISSLAALSTGLAKGAGGLQLVIGFGCAILAGLVILGAFLVNVIGRERPTGALLALGGAAACVVVFLPMIRDQALRGVNRVPCASNLRQIGQGIQLYANDHSGMTPARFEDLITATDLNPEVFVCPSSKDRPADPRKPLAEQFAVPGHCSYRYLVPNMRLADISNDTPMAVEDPADHNGDGGYVLFGDGHVDWLPLPDFRQLMSTTRPASRPVAATATSPTLR
jgi:hypothetical protein